MILRFAPSPTGWLHVGNARVALANALLARREGGRLLLRLDDTDAARSRPEYEAGIEQDLAWLGIGPDLRLRQSERLAVYAAAAERLRAAGRLYPCFESEEELRFRREQQRRRGAPPVYDRAALRMSEAQVAAARAAGREPYWRFRLSDGSVSWNDAVLGAREVRLATLSDPVLVRADGTPLYTFTSVVDDAETGVSLVLRGEDHVTNTAVQIDLARALGASAPAFAHLPLLVDAEGGKLSKRIDSLTLRGLRGDGVEAEALVGYLARIGTADPPVAGDLAALAPGFALERVSRSPARFDLRQVLGLNRTLLRGRSFEAVRDRLPAGATPGFWEVVRGNLDLLGEARGWWAVVAGEIGVPSLPEEGAFLHQAAALLPEAPWDGGTWGTWTGALRAASGRSGRALFHPLRLALTAEEEGPAMAALLPLMGRERALARLEAAAR